jgi:hypothetical protein
LLIEPDAAQGILPLRIPHRAKGTALGVQSIGPRRESEQAG